MKNIFKILLLLALSLLLTKSIFFQKRTIPDVNAQNKIFAFGDIGHFNDSLQNMVNICESNLATNDKIILLGDNFYPDGVKNTKDPLWMDFKNIFKNISKDKIHATIGNHDYHDNPNPQINNIYWNTPNFYYKVDFDKNIDIFILDTVQLYHDHCGISKYKIQEVHNKHIDNLLYNQLKWLNSSLENSNKKHKIIFGHYPIITNGIYSNQMNPLYDLLIPIFKKYNVNTYISGHEHNIQYIKHYDNDYALNQFIIGSSSEYRANEYCNKKFFDMYNNKDNFILQIFSYDNRLHFNFINSKNEVKYSYIV